MRPLFGARDRCEDRLGAFGPSERFREVLVVSVDVGVQGGAKVRDAGEDPAMDRAALQYGEPGLDGVEPRGARRREVEVKARMLREPALHLVGLVRAAVVEDDVNDGRFCGPPIDDFEKCDELGGAMAFGDLADHFTSGEVERGVQAQRSVPLVVVRASLDLAWPERQHGLRPVERLNLGLLVHGEDQRVLGRAHVQTDDVNDLLREPRVLADLEVLHSMRLEAGTLPYLPDLVLGDSNRGRHEPLAPVRRSRRFLLNGPAQNLHHLIEVQAPRAAGSCTLLQTLDSFLGKAPDPFVDVAGADADQTRDSAFTPSRVSRMMRAFIARPLSTF